MNAHTDTAAMLAATVDQLARVKAQIATLQETENSLKSILAEAGADSIEGTLHRAAVSISTKTTSKHA